MDHVKKLNSLSEHRREMEEDLQDQSCSEGKRRFDPPLLVKHGDFNSLTKTGAPQIFSP